MKLTVVASLVSLLLVSACATQPAPKADPQPAPEPVVALPMDELMAQLEPLEQMGLTVEKTDSGLRVVMPGAMAFASGSSEIDPAAYEALDRVATAMTALSAARADIVGHTDSAGRASYNQRLSEDRAEAVRAYVAGKGVETARMSALGKGEAEPIADNATAEGRAANRRVEISVTLN